MADSMFRSCFAGIGSECRCWKLSLFGLKWKLFWCVFCLLPLNNYLLAQFRYKSDSHQLVLVEAAFNLMKVVSISHGENNGLDCWRDLNGLNSLNFSFIFILIEELKSKRNLFFIGPYVDLIYSCFLGLSENWFVWKEDRFW